MTGERVTTTVFPSGLRPVAVVFASLALVGCDQGEGLLQGDRLVVESCKDRDEPRTFEPFRMRLEFMGVERAGDVMLIRLAPRARLIPHVDQLAVTIEGVLDVREELASSGAPVERPIGEGSVSVGLALFERCPYVVSPMIGGSGRIRFEALGLDKGSRVAASLDFELVDGRSGELIGTGFTTDFDMDIAVGTPFQHFNQPEVQNHTLP